MDVQHFLPRHGAAKLAAFQIALVLAVLPGAAYAAGKCASYKDLFSDIEKQVHEVHVLTGIMSAGQMSMELWVSPKRTWSIVGVSPDDMACIIMDGTDLMVSGNVPASGSGM